MSTATDPRHLRSRQAIIDAARELLLRHGPAAVTHQRIAEHAGIGRATVYRHWPRTDQLLGEAMATVPMPFFDAPSSPFRDWVVREVTAVARQLEQDDVLAVTATLVSSALWDPAMDERRAGFAAVLRDRLARGLEEAQRQGEFEPAVDAADAVALLLGPAVYRATIEHSPTTDAAIERAVAAIGSWTS